MWARHPDHPGAQRGPYRLSTLVEMIPDEWSGPAGLILARKSAGPWLGCDKYPGIYQKLGGYPRPLDHCGAWREAARTRAAKGQRRLAFWAYAQITELAPKARASWSEYGDYALELGLAAEAERAAGKLRKLGAADEAADLLQRANALALRKRTLGESGAASKNLSEPSVVHELGLRAGSVIAGRYELVSRLGRGGMGVVWKARDTLIDDIVAVKFLLGDYTRERGRQYFQREVRLARRVAHMNVCRVHDAGTHDSWPFITMEFVEGTSLLEALQGPRGTPWRLRVLRQVAEALAAIHAEGVIHRDLKPANVMVTPQSVVKVMDFGLARPVAGSDPRATGPLIGTPAYMSPEQLLGAALDQRTDIFAFGVMTWELFTGQLPFPGGEGATLDARLRGDLPKAGSESLPPRLLELVKRCLAVRPGVRPASMSAVLDVLRSESEGS